MMTSSKKSVFLFGLSLMCITIALINAQPQTQEAAFKQHFESPEMEAKWEAWLPTFKAADPEYQSYCMTLLSEKQGSSSQFEQDLFIFFNVFKYWPMTGRKGFYVDSGANHARTLSNTFFYDKCLGWQGLCVEPMVEYHADLKRLRSCTLSTDCISNKDEYVSFSDGATTAFVDKSKGAGNFHCNTLEAMMLASKGGEALHIDFWSLDVEGYEMTVLGGVDFTRISVNAMLIEDFWISTRDLDLFMTRHGFNKYQSMAIDALYLKRGLPAAYSPWYPPNYEKNLASNVEFRNKPETRQKLKC